jgi:hypothetical protein
MKTITILSLSLLLLAPNIHSGQNIDMQPIAAVPNSTEMSPIAPHESFTIKKDTVKRDVPWFVDRYKISIGFFAPISNTTVRVGTNDGQHGTEIDFEDDLGFRTNTQTFLANAQYRLSSRSRFDLSYYNIRRNSTRTLNRTIEFGEDVYEINTKISAFFDTEIYRFSYGYAIFSKPDYEIGLLIGTHIIGADAGIAAVAESQGAAADNSFGFTAPLPDFGIWGGFTIGKRFAFNGELDYLALKVDNTKGSIFGYNFLFIFRAVSKLDIALGFSGMHFKIDAIKDNMNGHFLWTYDGPSLRISYSFGRNNWK